jgi:hypothetical protein
VVSFGETVVEPRKWLAIYVLLLSSNEDKTKGGTSAAEKGGERVCFLIFRFFYFTIIKKNFTIVTNKLN